jgi:short-subunit dehydrogenase
MKALITGASSGIGRDMAIILSNMGHDLILVARSEDKLNKLKKELKTNVKVIAMDISSVENCKKLYEEVKKDNIDILINNAGFGLVSEFKNSDLDRELEMIDLNVKSLHTLTKLFYKDFIEKDSGYILNVASSAAFQPGPLMASYYASKAYVLRLTQAINEELRREKSKVYVGAVCPGPVDTNFNNVAGVRFTVKSLKSQDVTRYALRKMFKRKLVIVPGTIMKLTRICAKLLPEKLVTKIAYNIQKSKKK